MDKNVPDKKCRECLRMLPLTEFYKHSQMADGHLNKCITCVRDRVLRHREANLEKIKKYDRVRGRTEKRKAANRSRGQLMSALYARYTKAWARRNPHKRKAQLLAGYAKRCGRLKEHPCEVCGSTSVEMHHEDYAKPLEVRWLCLDHHKELHRKYKD